jgi:outer membrane murein-binding lipoprotein Lpp
MSAPNLHAVASDVERLKADVKALEDKVDAVMLTQRWQMGAAVGFGSVLTMLLPVASKALGWS